MIPDVYSLAPGPSKGFVLYTCGLPRLLTVVSCLPCGSCLSWPQGVADKDLVLVVLCGVGPRWRSRVLPGHVLSVLFDPRIPEKMNQSPVCGQTCVLVMYIQVPGCTS